MSDNSKIESSDAQKKILAVSDEALCCTIGSDDQPVFLFLGIPGSGEQLVARGLQMAVEARNAACGPNEPQMRLQRLGDQENHDNNLVGDKDIHDFKRISMARHPCARLAAVWRSVIGPEAKRRNPVLDAAHPDLATGVPFEEFCEYVTSIDGADPQADPLWRSQHQFLCNQLGIGVVDFCGFHERIESEFLRITQIINLPEIPLPGEVNLIEQAWDESEWSMLYNRYMTLLIYNRYEIDFEVFKYKI